MSDPDYIILQPLNGVDKIYLISKHISVKETSISVLKVSGSSFLYPETYYFIGLKDYIELNSRNVNTSLIKKIISELCAICTKYEIHPSTMLEVGVTFDEVSHRFAYPKQLINASYAASSLNAFIFLSNTILLLKQSVIGIEDKAELLFLIEQILDKDSQKHKDKSFFESPEVQDESEMQKEEEEEEENKENELKITDTVAMGELIEKKKKYYQEQPLMKFLQGHLDADIYDINDESLIKIYKFANIYKKVGNHKLARTLFNHFNKVISQIQAKEEKMYDREIPEQTKVKLSEEQSTSTQSISSQIPTLNVQKIVRLFIESLEHFHKVEDGMIMCSTPQHSVEWHSQRKMRVTASNFGNILKASTYERKIKVVQDMLFPKFFGNAATKYGTDTESVARDAYLEKMKEDSYEVREFGLLIDSEFCWIAGSPDGIVYQDGKKIGSIEIKCPYSIRDRKVSEAYNETGFLEMRDGELKLKRSHNYFLQCQGIMKLSMVDWCDFVIFTQVECVIVRVPFDEDFVKNMYEQLSSFYFEFLIVENILPTPSINILQQSLDPDLLAEIKAKGFKVKPEPSTPIQEDLEEEDQEENSRTESLSQSLTEPFDGTQPL